MLAGDECQIAYCNLLTAEGVGIPLCENHIRKAWAAFYVLYPDGQPEEFREPARHQDWYDKTAKGYVYVARVGELIKIGWSSNYKRRASALGADAILLVRPGTREDEAQLHERFQEHLALGREWFHPADELMDFIRSAK